MTLLLNHLSGPHKAVVGGAMLSVLLLVLIAVSQPTLGFWACLSLILLAFLPALPLVWFNARLGSGRAALQTAGATLVVILAVCFGHVLTKLFALIQPMLG